MRNVSVFILFIVDLIRQQTRRVTRQSDVSFHTPTKFAYATRKIIKRNASPSSSIIGEPGRVEGDEIICFVIQHIIKKQSVWAHAAAY